MSHSFRSASRSQSLRRRFTFVWVLCGFLTLLFSGHSWADTDPKIIYSRLSKDIFPDPYSGHCAYRADVWAYELQLLTSQKVSKVMLLFTHDFDPNDWGFHIAPVMTIGGEQIVFERANGIEEPMELNTWMKKVNGGKACEVVSELPGRFMEGFHSIVQDSFGYHLYEYRASKVAGDCIGAIVEVETQFPGGGSQVYRPLRSAPLQPLDWDRAVWSCTYGKPNKKKTMTCERELDSFLKPSAESK